MEIKIDWAKTGEELSRKGADWKSVVARLIAQLVFKLSGWQAFLASIYIKKVVAAADKAAKKEVDKIKDIGTLKQLEEISKLPSTEENDAKRKELEKQLLEGK